MEILAALVGAGIVAASPFVPVLRPVAKAAVKGGLAVGEAAVGVATAVSQQVNEAKAKNKVEPEEDSAAEVTAPDSVVADSDAEAPQTDSEVETTEQLSGIATVTAALRPTVQTAVKYGVAATEKAKTAAIAAGKQWSDLVAEAKESQGNGTSEEVPVSDPAPEEPVAAAKSDAKTEAIVEPEPVVKAEAPVEPPPAPQPDDLTAIRGLGPKTATLLGEAGITTFAQLGAADEAQLRKILADAGGGYRSINPADWPEHARRIAKAA